MTAQEQGLAAVSRDQNALYEGALARIRQAREGLEALMREGVISAVSA